MNTHTPVMPVNGGISIMGKSSIEWDFSYRRNVSLAKPNDGEPHIPVRETRTGATKYLVRADRNHGNRHTRAKRRSIIWQHRRGEDQVYKEIAQTTILEI